MFWKLTCASVLSTPFLLLGYAYLFIKPDLTKSYFCPYGELTIYRDEYSVPHVHAENELAMIFGQGLSVA
jgi:acyl-homoserine lactone acylase PvdQ